MILGFDHLALSVTDTDLAQAELEENGFTCVFMQKGTPNAQAKRIFLSTYHVSHDLALFRPSSKGISIEITNHGDKFGDGLTPYSYKGDHIVLKTPVPEKESLFFREALGFQSGEDGFINLSSPLPNGSCLVKLIEGNADPQYTLDANGYTCLAFITNDIQGDTDRARNAGAVDIIEPFEMRVNNRNLVIIMYRSPGGAICELIRIQG